MAIVGEPCNTDAHAKIPARFNVQSSLPENVVFSVCAQMGNAAYIISIMWNSISGLDAWYYFRFNISYGVAVMVRSHQIEFQVIF